MKKRIALLLVVTLILSCSISTFADGEDGMTEESGYATGLLEMTEEEFENMQARVPMIVDVKPNKLYMERLYEELGISGGDMAVGNGGIANTGEELVTSFYEEAVLVANENSIAYPSKVDNSTEDTFPVIDNQGGLGSCVGWSFGYYQLTNNANRVRGTAAREGSSNIDANIYSPNWIYNLGNGGYNFGMKYTSAIDILYEYGCPTICEVPIVTDTGNEKNYRSWYPESLIWERALYNKCDISIGRLNPYRKDTPITAPDSKNLDDIKRLLADGYVVTISTVVNTDENDNDYFAVTKKGKTSTGESAYVWTEVRDWDKKAGHALTIVGYDDGFKVDINNNGSYETGEYGAFKMANSWGTDVERHNDGYVWIAYDALNKKSSVLNSDTLKRIGAFNYDTYYFVKPQKEYKPLLLGTVELGTQNRGGLYALSCIENVDTLEYCERPFSENNWIAFVESKGNYNFEGTSGYATGSFTFDFTSLLKYFELDAGGHYNVYLKLIDSTVGSTTTINSFTLKDMNSGEVYTSADTAISIIDDTVQADVTYLSSIRSVENRKVFTLTFNSPLAVSDDYNLNIAVQNSRGGYCAVDISPDQTRKKLFLSAYKGKFDNDFYTINIYPGLKSEGGNGFDSTVIIPFYVPFH